MPRLTPFYFLQTQEWLKFWKAASGTGHDYKYFEDANFFGYIYEYPWLTNKWGQKFWYIPKGIICKDDISNLTLANFEKFLSLIIEAAKKQKIAYLKVDFDDETTHLLNITNNSELETALKDKFATRINFQTKPIQYLTCSYLNFTKLPKFENQDGLDQVFENTQSFWKSTSSQVKRYTKKILAEYQQGNWAVSIEKNQANFEDFYKIHTETAARQNFPTQSRAYLKSFFDQNFSRVIIIRDNDNQAQCVWLGVCLNNALTYLLGGNTQVSLDNHVQYLLHLQALKICRVENIDIYDLGGHDSRLGYGQFKDRYNPTIRTFLGPVDIILQPNKYWLINTTIKIKDKIRSLSTKKT